MPIRPENAARYPANWHTEIRPRILNRARNQHGWPCCEECGVGNHAIGYRDSSGKFHDTGGLELQPNGEKLFKIVLTIAHLNDKIEDVSDENLRAWCQRCHNRYDLPMRRRGLAERARAAKASGDLFA